MRAGIPSSATGGPGAPNAGVGRGPIVTPALHSDVSPPLRTIPPIPPAVMRDHEGPENPLAPVGLKIPLGPDPALQRVFGPLAMPTPSQHFAGQNNLWTSYPPDTNGDVGRNEYVQIVNYGFEIFSKTGTPLYGPANNNTLWTGFGGLCESTNRGDPIALYDPLADRWLLSQFAIDPANGTDTHQCFALSTSPDPLGSYYRYDFHTSPTAQIFEDYPKIGVWPDAYYMTAREFTNNTFTGGGAFAFERTRMLQGDPGATMIYFHHSLEGMLPSDLDGAPPPPGSPNYFLTGGPTNTQLQEFKFHVDFSNPPNSTFSGPTIITVPAYNPTVCTGVYRSACVDQPGTPVKLEVNSFPLMYRLQYRNFPGDHETLIVNHTVNATGGNPGLAGIRWYEIRNPLTTTVAYQAGTYQAADGSHAWMASAAMDRLGNMAVGFSASSTTVYPAIRYAGRLAGDPLNTLAQGEQTLLAGGGSELLQLNPNDARWGDYSMMAVDPTDDCTFWYTTEYMPQTSLVSWRTRIAAFKFPNCPAQGTPTPVPSPTGTPPTVTPTATATPPLCPGGASLSGAITTSDPTQNGLLAFSNVQSSCAAPKTCPAIMAVGQVHYDSYTYSNTSGQPQCVTVTLDARACETILWTAAYLTSFDPANICANYLADPGQANPLETYSFLVPAGASYVVVVNEIDANIGCSLYHLTVNPCVVPPPSTATATPGPVTPSATATITATPACGAAPPWQAGPTLTPARWFVQGAVADDGKFYVADGLSNNGTRLTEAARFNPSTTAWEALPPLVVAVGGASIGAGSGKVFVAGGILANNTVTRTLQIYDIAANAWSLGTALPVAAEDGAGVVLDGKFYVIGGDNGVDLFRSTYVYDIATGTWTSDTPIPDLDGRSNTYGTTAGGLIYVWGGVHDTANHTIDTMLAFNPATHLWATLASAGTPGLSNLGGVSPYGPGRLLVSDGGDSSAVPAATTQIYDIATDAYSPGPSLTLARLGHAQGTLADGRVIVYGGRLGNNTTTETSEILVPPPPCATATATAGPPTTTATLSVPTHTATRVVSPTPAGSATRTATTLASPPAASATRTATALASATVAAATRTPPALASATVAAATLTPTPCTLTFSDVQTTDYFYAPVQYLYCHGVLSGYADGTFRPYNNTTRAQMVKIVVLGFGLPLQTPAGGVYTFHDVDPTNPFFAVIETAAARQIVSGYACGQVAPGPCDEAQRPYFLPNNSVTRGQLSKIDTVAAGWPLLTPASATFTDVAPGSPFYAFVETAACHGVVSGYADGTFRPGANATRGQIAKIVALSLTAGGACPAAAPH